MADENSTILFRIYIIISFSKEVMYSYLSASYYIMGVIVLSTPSRYTLCDLSTLNLHMFIYIAKNFIIYHTFSTFNIYFLYNSISSSANQFKGKFNKISFGCFVGFIYTVEADIILKGSIHKSYLSPFLYKTHVLKELYSRI